LRRSDTVRAFSILNDNITQQILDEYKPTLREVERILAEAGLDEEEIKQAGAGKIGPQTQSRNRR
jgi:hypothetical protein